MEREVQFTFPLEIFKQAEEAGEFHVIGYAATVDFDKQGDILTAESLKAAAQDLVNNSTVLLNHDLKKPIGRVVSVKFDKRGLLIDALISSTEPDVIQKIKEGVLNKFSIRGQVLDRERKWDKAQDRVINVIKKVALIEASLVSVPANPEAKAIGWYIQKALEGETPPSQGGNAMDPKKEEGAAPPPADDKGKETPPAKPKEGQGKPPEEKPAPPAGTPPAEPAPKEPESADVQKMFAKMNAQIFAPLLAKLEQIAEAGDEKVKSLVQEAKAATQQAMGLAPFGTPVAKSDAPPAKPDVSELVQAEVKKQLDKAVESIPTLRKGLTPNGGGKDGPTTEEEVIKVFEKLDPSDKLRALLTVQHGKEAR